MINIRSYLYAKQALGNGSAILEVEAKAFGVPYRTKHGFGFVHGWLNTHGDVELTKDAEVRLREDLLNSNNRSSAEDGLHVLDATRSKLSHNRRFTR